MEFAYRNIELYKSESLGSGSYGGVCKAKCDGLLCAAKIMHPTLFDPSDPGTASYLRKFQEECHLFSLARHPNIVQYLGTCYDPDTQLPVLLMELCDKSLTAFLEHSPAPLSYHIQLNICHDIALALVYLHSNGIIHRDLTGNNVLMIAGTRAKITDFGMSKLATISPHMKALTQCPGNVLYMSPEALDEAKSYTAKLDIFSFGVVVIQTLTKKFPNPTDRFRTVYVPNFDEALRQVIPDTERRQAHLQLISDTHSLKPLAIQCLEKNESERPSALQLSERLSELKQMPKYTESMHQAHHDIQQLQQQLQSKIVIEAKTMEVSEHQPRITELQNLIEESQLILTIEAKDRQLQEKEHIIKRTNDEHQHAIVTRERELQQTQEQLWVSEQLVTELEQSLQQKDKTISDLKQTLLAQEAKIQWLEQQNKARRAQPQLQPVTTDIPPATVAEAWRDFNKMTWRERTRAPQAMCRGAAVVHRNTAYFRPVNSQKVYSYQNIVGEEQWTRLPDNSYKAFGLAVIDGQLTSVGGCKDEYTSTLLSFTGEGESKQWSEVYPPMPTPRQSVSCITTEQALVVTGGYAGDYVDTVEVMNISAKQWSAVCPLPQKLAHYSSITCGDTLYLAGGFIDLPLSKCVFTCSLPGLLQPETFRSRIRRKLSLSDKTGFKEIHSLPVTYATLASFGGHLLAIGGCDDTGNTTNDIYRYDSHTDSWNVISQMKNKRSHCFAVTLPHDRLLVVGGTGILGALTDSAEIWEI